MADETCRVCTEIRCRFGEKEGTPRDRQSSEIGRGESMGSGYFHFGENGENGQDIKRWLVLWNVGGMLLWLLGLGFDEDRSGT